MHNNQLTDDKIASRILMIRGQRVLLATDIAKLYGVTTKRLNEQIRRNKVRFPADFMFQLTKAETHQVAANCGHLRQIKFSAVLPYAFTEHGVLMLANVLHSEKAVLVSVRIIRTFIRLREITATHKELALKLHDLEHKVGKHDDEIQSIFIAIRQLMKPSEPPRRRIGFHP
ncbi:MAG: ORF6N domain-containing protein [Candidatus Omnitrophica bacterium]|nr:ORF6N domain-containing protein [Candidatus Omnitrophota bacterium]MDD5671873.1 ORF6N domain-containing protein [Candidatus Omnitrophota bacterium]